MEDIPQALRGAVREIRALADALTRHPAPTAEDVAAALTRIRRLVDTALDRTDLSPAGPAGPTPDWRLGPRRPGPFRITIEGDARAAGNVPAGAALATGHVHVWAVDSGRCIRCGRRRTPAVNGHRHVSRAYQPRTDGHLHGCRTDHDPTGSPCTEPDH